jgi:multiple sugar transport system permease protein
MATETIPMKNAGPVKGQSIKRQRRTINFVTYVLLGLGAAIVLVPFWWMVRTSLTAETRLFEYPAPFIPNPIVLKNYAEAWNALPVSFTRFTMNTLFITVLAMVAEIFTCSLVA